MKIGLFAFADSVDDLTELAATANEQGFDSLWVPQVFGIDALTAIAVTGSQVPDITFATAVVPTYPRHPQMLAQQALTVNSVIDGRLVLGIGPSHKPVVEESWGISFDKPIRHLREYLECLMPLLHDKRARFRGESLTTRADISIDAPAPKVMMAALGPQLLKVTGRLADGTILWMTGPKTIADHSAPTINEAAAAAGRPKPEVVAGIPICVTDGSDADNRSARERAAKTFAMYGDLPSYRAMLDREGYEGPGDIAIIGGPAEVEDRIQAFATAGMTTLSASEFGDRGQRAATRDLLISML
ncbi:MAG: TIGR03564 family F420-dependent LLM class oxidoreductase [Actinomycetia bacterium]|nr:TIGR03564 family F420-dependent LLM class oxidoreductase [Actinomycetes bacterium]MCP4227688.1 TIGR03564 family F420-dependent LLM class oxidoreductase [Actinomycetes bacterium]MCP5033143.1 TIGR03564 family F420-dependent LLM class oxidoreductase [Actinomycetes bacterium]